MIPFDATPTTRIWRPLGKGNLRTAWPKRWRKGTTPTIDAPAGGASVQTVEPANSVRRRCDAGFSPIECTVDGLNKISTHVKYADDQTSFGRIHQCRYWEFIRASGRKQLENLVLQFRRGTPLAKLAPKKILTF